MSAAPGLGHPTTRASLGRWLLLSAAAHLLLFVGWLTSPHFHGQRETVLSISLAPGMALPIPYPTLANSATSTTPARKDDPSGIRHEPAADTRPTPVPPSPDNARTADGQGHSAESVAAQIRATLLSDLARHFDYPLLARLRGWEGTVLIGLDVEADGFLRQIHLARSSGYDVLDQSAIEAVRRVGRLQDTSSWPGTRHQHIRLPVIYRLTER